MTSLVRIATIILVCAFLYIPIHLGQTSRAVPGPRRRGSVHDPSPFPAGFFDDSQNARMIRDRDLHLDAVIAAPANHDRSLWVLVWVDEQAFRPCSHHSVQLQAIPLGGQGTGRVIGHDVDGDGECVRVHLKRQDGQNVLVPERGMVFVAGEDGAGGTDGRERDREGARFVNRGAAIERLRQVANRAWGGWRRPRNGRGEGAGRGSRGEGPTSEASRRRR